MLELSGSPRLGNRGIPPVRGSSNKTSAAMADRIIRVLEESAGGHGVEAGLNLGAVHRPVKPVPPEAICPDCGSQSRKETLEVWSAEEGWRTVERSVCLNRPRKGGAPGERCGKVTVMSEKPLSRKAPESPVKVVARAALNGHKNGNGNGNGNGHAVPAAEPTKNGRRYTEEEMTELRRRVLDEGEELYPVCDALGIPRAAGHTIVYWERMRREGKSLQRPRKGSPAAPEAAPAPPPPAAPAVEAKKDEANLETIVAQLGSLDLKTFLALPEESRAAIQHLLQAHG